MKAGDTVECIGNTYRMDKLTVGKEYTILSAKPTTLAIIADDGEVRSYYRSRFKPRPKLCKVRIKL